MIPAILIEYRGQWKFSGLKLPCGAAVAMDPANSKFGAIRGRSRG